MSRTVPGRPPPPPPGTRARVGRAGGAGGGGPASRPAAPRPSAGSAAKRTGPGRFWPAPDLRGPKITLGAVWAVAVAVTLIPSAFMFTVLMAAMAALAAAQMARTWKRATTPRAPVAYAASAATGITVLAALLGPGALVAIGVLAVAAAGAWVVTDASRRGSRPSVSDLALTLACAAVPFAAVIGPVLLRRHGLESAFVLVAYALVYDVGSWVMGSGSRHAWIGPLAGMACIGSVTVMVAALAPQFHGASPWELGALAAVLAPLGPLVANLVVGDRRAHVAALRRLDSLVLLGPVWAIAAARLGV